MYSKNYQMFFVIGNSMERPYNSLEFWPTATAKRTASGGELPVQTVMARQIYEYEA